MEMIFNFPLYPRGMIIYFLASLFKRGCSMLDRRNSILTLPMMKGWESDLDWGSWGSCPDGRAKKQFGGISVVAREIYSLDGVRFIVTLINPS